MALTNLQANITLDVYDHDGAKPSIKTIALDDNTRYVLANIRSRGEVYDIGSSATVQLIVIRPDKVGVQIAGQAQGIEIGQEDESVVTVYGAYAELDQAAIVLPGTLLGQFKITSGDQILRTQIFQILNGEALDSDTWAGDYDGYNLDELVADVAEAVEKVGDLETDVAQIKEDFTDIAPAIIETVSGAVASFTDGADGLPMDISVDSASASAVITKTGKNLSAPFASGSNTAKGLTAVFDGNGRITITGTTTETNADTSNKYFGGNTVTPIKFVGGRTYTITIDGTCEVSNNEVRIRLFDADNTSIWTANSGTGIWSITPESDFVANRIAIRFARSGNTVNIDGYIQIEEGDTATEYEAFDGQMVTATLVNGVVQEELTSKKGINHVWSDADVTVSYRADTKLYIDKKLGV